MKKLIILLAVTLVLCLPLAVYAEESREEASAQSETIELWAEDARMPIDLTGIAVAIISLCGALVAGYLIPWIKSKTTAEQQAIMDIWIRTFVEAAEQLYKTGKVKDRLKYVLEELRKKGFEVDTAEVEAAVWEINQEVA